MTVLTVIVVDTIREAFRNRIVLALLFIACLLLFLHKITGIVTLGLKTRILLDMGSVTITIFALLLAASLMVHLLRYEMERGTLQFTLTSPVSRGSLLLGKMLGVLVISAIVIAVLTTELYLLLLFTGGVQLQFFWFGFLLFLKCLVVINLTIIPSILSSRVITLTLVSFLVLLAHLGEMLTQLIPEKIVNILFGILFPDFTSFAVDFSSKLPAGFYSNFLPMISLYAFSLAMIYFLIARGIFARKSL
jgi:ABC-type transport system involved in multi-copper enzyme maturation permease subunit